MQESQDPETKWYELMPGRERKKNIAEKAFKELGRKEERKVIIRYSGHFRNYNSNARYSNQKIEFNLSSQWEEIDEDIQIGLIQSLIVRVYRLRGINTQSMELYESFMKNLSKYAKKHTHDPVLEESFNRVNEKYFNGMMDKPNLIFAGESFTKLGSYEYGTDTVYISSIFQNLSNDDVKYLDYVLYHELLHKKHTYKVKNGRHHAHTTAFRKDEEKFGKDMEKQLSKFLRRKRYAQGPLRDMFRLW